MNVDTSNQNSSSRICVEQSPYKNRVPLSFLAYLRVIRSMFFGLLIAAIFAFVGVVLHREWMGFLSLFAVGVWGGYEVAKLRNTFLFTDRSGVWVASGVFPWQKTVSGVSWRQVGGAGYKPGFGGWLFGSFRLHVQGRFNENAGFVLNDVKNGDAVATHINQMVGGGVGFADHGR